MFTVQSDSVFIKPIRVCHSESVVKFLQIRWIMHVVILKKKKKSPCFLSRFSYEFSMGVSNL